MTEQRIESIFGPPDDRSPTPRHELREVRPGSSVWDDCDPLGPGADPTTPRQVGPYRIDRRLGSGGMGHVFAAFDERLLRPVALKQIRPDSADDGKARLRFQREARAAARLRHPNIVEVHDLVEDGDGDWIVMELVEGETLDDLLERGPLRMDRVMALAIGLARALGMAHSQGIVHRDLKAKNVLVTAAGQPKVLDFGLAKQIIYGEGLSVSITADGQILGTPHAMSPEQALGRPVDLRSDLFSFGSLLYRVATGVAPFLGATPMDSLRRVCVHQPPSVRHLAPSVPAALAELIGALLEKDPAHRPASAVGLAVALQAIETDRLGAGACGPRPPVGPGSAVSGPGRLVAETLGVGETTVLPTAARVAATPGTGVPETGLPGAGSPAVGDPWQRSRGQAGPTLDPESPTLG